MIELVAILAVAVGAIALLAVRENRGETPVERGAAATAGAAAHLKSGEFPATCSWCRSTALARRMTVYERVDGTWRAFDVHAAASELADGEAATLLRRFLKTELQDVRRVCSEACARQLLGAAGVTPEAVEAHFVRCGYCSARHAQRLGRCPNCGALVG
jgi:hypothetical protein